MQITRNFASLLIASVALATFAGCGGGGDSGAPPASTPAAPTITSQPTSVIAVEGNTAEFGVAAAGSSPLTYQWRRNNVAITGAVSAVYVTPALTLADNAAQYSVVVTNSGGAATSAAALLTVNAGLSELSLLVGTSTGGGYLDGASSTARFASPYAIAFDAAGNAYVSDGGNAVIRKIDAAGTVSTFAGSAGLSAQQDGLQGNARFSFPRGLTVDAGGVVYVADYDGNTIRRISAAGAVTTLAGSAAPGPADGTGPTAQFDAPSGVALDGIDLLVTDSRNHTIRRITPAGVVTTVAGQALTPGTTDGVGAAASFTNPWAIAPAGAGRFIILECSFPVRLRLLQGTNVTTLATFPGPASGHEGLAVDSSGNAFVAATFSHVIYRWDQATGLISVVAGTAGASGAVNAIGAQARFTRPRGMAFRNTGELVIADTGNRSLHSLSLGTQTVTTFSGSLRAAGYVDATGSAARFGSPFAIRPEATGTLLLLDFDTSAVRRVADTGSVSTFHASAPGAAGLAPESSGSVLVAQTDTSVIERISPAGVVSVFAGTRNQRGSSDGPIATALFDDPRALALDSAGGVFVADGNGTIRYISPAGIVSTYAGAALQTLLVDGPRAQARFQYPGEIALDGLGNMYVLDLGTHTVRKIDASGIVSTVAGKAFEPGYADGPGSVARFNAPQALAVDSANNVYVADSYNHVIRKITTAGIVSTVVGSAGIGTFQPGALPGRISFPSGIAIVGRNLYITHEDGVLRVTYVP